MYVFPFEPGLLPNCVELGNGRFVLVLSEEEYVFCDGGKYIRYRVSDTNLLGIHSGRWMGEHLWGAWRGTSNVFVLDGNRVVARSTLLLPSDYTFIPQGVLTSQGKFFAVGCLFHETQRGVLAVKIGEEEVTVLPQHATWLGEGAMMYIDNPAGEFVYLIDEEGGEVFLYTFDFPDGVVQVRQRVRVPNIPCLFSVSSGANYLAFDRGKEGIQIYDRNRGGIVASLNTEQIEWCNGWAIGYTYFTPHCVTLNLATLEKSDGYCLFGPILDVIDVSGTHVVVVCVSHSLYTVETCMPQELQSFLVTSGEYYARMIPHTRWG